MPRGAVPFPFGKCVICQDQATGIHYGAETCEGCKGFYKRSLVKFEKYTCSTNGHCAIGPENRIKCKFCRFQRCLAQGMSMQAIKMGRIPKAEKQKAIDGPHTDENSLEEDVKCENGEDRSMLRTSTLTTNMENLKSEMRSKVAHAQLHSNSFSEHRPSKEGIPSPPLPKVPRQSNSSDKLNSLPHLDEKRCESMVYESVPEHFKTTSHEYSSNPVMFPYREPLHLPTNLDQKTSQVEFLLNSLITLKDQPNESRELDRRPSSLCAQTTNSSQTSAVHCPTSLSMVSKPNSTCNYINQINSHTNGHMLRDFGLETNLTNSNSMPPNRNSSGHDYSRGPVSFNNRFIQQPAVPVTGWNNSQTTLSCAEIAPRLVQSSTHQNVQPHIPDGQPKLEMDLDWTMHTRSKKTVNRGNVFDNEDFHPFEPILETQGNCMIESTHHHGSTDSTGKLSSDTFINPQFKHEEHDSDYVSSSSCSPKQPANYEALCDQLQRLVHDVAIPFKIIIDGIKEAIRVMNRCIKNNDMEGKVLPFCKENLKLTWAWLMESVNTYNEDMMKFIKSCPYMHLIPVSDLVELIKYGYLSLWLVWNAPLFKNGDSYIPFNNGFVYTRIWMENILPPDFVEYLHDYTREQNSLNLSIHELGLLSAIAITGSGLTELHHNEQIQAIYAKYLQALEFEISRTRVNPEEIMSLIKHLLDRLKAAIKQQEIILSFEPETPPPVNFNGTS